MVPRDIAISPLGTVGPNFIAGAVLKQSGSFVAKRRVPPTECAFDIERADESGTQLSACAYAIDEVGLANDADREAKDTEKGV
jgi:hypothetical protein